MMEAIHSCEIRATRRHIPEDGTLQSDIGFEFEIPLKTKFHTEVAVDNFCMSRLAIQCSWRESNQNGKEWRLLGCTRRNIPEDDIFHDNRRETLKSYIALTGWTL
jgi:hypothetical protein